MISQTTNSAKELRTLSGVLTESLEEMERRQKARQSLIAFTEYTNPRYRTAPHHILIAQQLERIASGEIDRLMIFMPPRHGKSELASRRFPAFLLGSCSHKAIICASYSSDLATDFGRDVRNIVKSPDYGNLFETRLADDSQAANRWHTQDGGAYVAAGVGTAITGRGADILLIDDPVKDREEADSENARQKVWDWYISTAYSRIEGEIGTGKTGAVVLIQTRWHEDDLAGRLLAAQDKGGDRWEILDLPAITSAGEALWPDKYDLKALERIRGVIGPRDWSALYQQSPSPEEGTFFSRDWLRYYEYADKPKHLRMYGASDYAVTDGGGDFTVHGVIGIDPQDNIYVLDWWRGQTASDIWIEVLLDLMAVWRPLAWAEEKGQIEKSVGPFIDKRQRERAVYCARKQYASAADKPTRAQAIRGRLAQGKVYLPSDKPWTPIIERALLTFPAGAVDDDVDVLSLFGRMLAEMVGGILPAKHVNGQDRWARVFEDAGETDSWKVV